MYREFILRQLEQKADLKYPEDKDLINEVQSLKKLLAWLDILEDSLVHTPIRVGDIIFDYNLHTIFVDRKPVKFQNSCEGLYKLFYEVGKE